jgi:amino acid transporter
MCRRVTSAGGFYTFVTRGLGRVLGLGSGLLIALCYMVFTAAVTGTMGYFASTTVASLTGLDLPAWVYMIIGLALMTAFALFHIELTAKVLGVALVAEVLVLTVLAVGVFASGGAEGFSLAPLNPLAIFDNPAAVQVFGAGASGIALFAAFWSWVGFEMAPNYAEETRDPHRIARTATYGSVIGLGVLYVIISYVYVTGWGLTGAAEAVRAQYAGEIASAFYPLTDRYVGAWATVLMEILIVTGSFACAMAFSAARACCPRRSPARRTGAARSPRHRWSPSSSACTASPSCSTTRATRARCSSSARGRHCSACSASSGCRRSSRSRSSATS